jgi:hypothetical protein
MREYLTAALPKKRRYEVKRWNANIFNNDLMDKVENALKNMASRW